MEYDMQSFNGDTAARQEQAPTVHNPAYGQLRDAIVAGMNFGANATSAADLMHGDDVPALPPWDIPHPAYGGPLQQFFPARGAADNFLLPGPVQAQLETESVPTIAISQQNPIVALPPVRQTTSPDAFVVGSPPVTTPREPERPLADAAMTAQQRFEAEFPQGFQVHIPRLADIEARPEVRGIAGDRRLETRHVTGEPETPLEDDFEPTWHNGVLTDWHANGRRAAGVRTTRNEIPTRDRATGRLHTTGNVVSADGRTM